MLFMIAGKCSFIKSNCLRSPLLLLLPPKFTKTFSLSFSLPLITPPKLLEFKYAQYPSANIGVLSFGWDNSIIIFAFIRPDLDNFHQPFLYHFVAIVQRHWDFVCLIPVFMIKINDFWLHEQTLRLVWDLIFGLVGYCWQVVVLTAPGKKIELKSISLQFGLLDSWLDPGQIGH